MHLRFSLNFMTQIGEYFVDCRMFIDVFQHERDWFWGRWMRQGAGWSQCLSGNQQSVDTDSPGNQLLNFAQLAVRATQWNLFLYKVQTDEGNNNSSAR